MTAGDATALLQARIACLPGGRDRQGRPLLTATVDDNLGAALRLLIVAFSPETRRAGLTVLLDARRCPWRTARAAIRTVLTIGSDIGRLIVLRPEAFWDNQKVDCTKVHKDGEPICIPISRLNKFIDSAQLPEEYGGTWTYNHNQWIQNRMCLDGYITDVNGILEDLSTFQQRLQEFTVGDRVSTCTDPMSFSKLTYDTNQSIAQAIYQRGRDIVSRIEKTEKECQQHLPQDTLDSKLRLEQFLMAIQQKLESVEAAWIALQKKFLDAREIRDLELGVARVTQWILGTAENLLNDQQQVGYDVASSEELRAEHESLELQCRETYGHYAELLHKIDILPQLNIHVPEDLRSQRDFMDFVCRSFASRLERRRNILITCLRFYRLVTEYFEKTSQVFESLVMYTDADSLESADCSLQELSDSQINIDYLAKELVKEGEKLSDLLSMPVKDAMGRDIDVNYESDIVNVQEILQATLSRKQLFSDSVDLQKLTLEQVTHIHVYEQDAAQAAQWLTDLFAVLIKDIHVGSSVHEIQLMKEDLQVFQETAKGTYLYGGQLLTAALALRNSCKLPDDLTIKLQEQLEDTWRKLETVTQEQMTRLRVCAVFHRSVKEHCLQLKELLSTVMALCSVEDLSRRRSKIRKCLQTREKLLLEVGRMVRLGRLLKTRLREPLHTNLFPRDDGNATSVEAISDRLTEVTNVAEQLDVALCAASSSALTPNIKQILDGTASTAPEEWYQSLKPPPAKSTPNTSSDSKSEDEFLTASDCTCTPPSRASSFQTASEGGAASPWWEIEPNSDSDEKIKTKIHNNATTERISHQLTSEITVREISDKPKTEQCFPFALEDENRLRPDMAPIRTSQRESSQDSTTRTSEIVKQLSQIVQSNEEASRDIDTSSQYSSELIIQSGESHTKSLSFETDNTDLSLPRFSAAAPASVPKLNGVKKTPADDEAAYRKEIQRFASTDDNAKIYIIDTSTPSPKSQRYLETSFDVYDVPRQFEERLTEVREQRQRVTTINLQPTCPLPPPDYYPATLKRMAIQGIF